MSVEKIVGIIEGSTKLSKGDIVTLKKIEVLMAESNMDAVAVFQGATKIGSISISERVHVPGAVISPDLLKKSDELTNGIELEAVVIEEVKVGNAATTKYLMEVDLDQLNQPEEEEEEEEDAFDVPDGSAMLEFNVRGGIIEFPGKSEVIEAFTDGKEVAVSVALAEDESLVLTSNAAAGPVGKITVEDEEDYKTLIEKLKASKSKSLPGRVVEAKMKSYRVAIAVDEKTASSGAKAKPFAGIKEVKQSLVDAGVNDIKTLNEIEAYLKKEKMPAGLIQEIFEQHRAYDDEYKDRIQQKPKTPYINSNGVLANALVYVLGGSSVRLSGDASTGKNVLIDTLSWVFQRPLFTNPVNGETQKEDIVGAKGTDIVIDENGNGVSRVIFEKELVIRAMECGGFYSLDEVNLGRSSVLELLNSVLDYRKSIDAPGYKYVKAQEGFVAFATMNPNYEDTKEINEAFKSRFITIKFPPCKDIYNILKVHDRCKGTDDKILRQLNDFYKKLYEMVYTDNTTSPQILSLRMYAEAAHYAANPYLDLKSIIQDCIVNIIDDEIENQDINKVVVEGMF